MSTELCIRIYELADGGRLFDTGDAARYGRHGLCVVIDQLNRRGGTCMDCIGLSKV